MRLDLSPILNAPGSSLPFDGSLDLSDLEFFGARPICEPLRVSGVVRNRAGALMLEARLESSLHWHCDRCAAPFVQQKTVQVDALLAASLENEEEADGVYLLEGAVLPLGELARSAFVLEMDTKHLCAETCRGLCPTCGHNLNEGPCTCQKTPDPRFAALQQLLDLVDDTES